MKRQLFICTALFIALGAGTDVMAQQYASIPSSMGREPMTFQIEGADTDQLCADSEFGVQFYCQSSWKWRRLDDALLIIISSEPTITLTVTKTSYDLRFLSQLTKTFFEERGLYADGFQTEWVTFANEKAIHVKAFSRSHDEIRLSHYYYLHNNNVYGTLFSVHPREDWANNQNLIQKIVKSFEFIDPTEEKNK